MALHEKKRNSVSGTLSTWRFKVQYPPPPPPPHENHEKWFENLRQFDGFSSIYRAKIQLQVAVVSIPVWKNTTDNLVSFCRRNNAEQHEILL